MSTSFGPIDCWNVIVAGTATGVVSGVSAPLAASTCRGWASAPAGPTRWPGAVGLASLTESVPLPVVVAVSVAVQSRATPGTNVPRLSVEALSVSESGVSTGGGGGGTSVAAS